MSHRRPPNGNDSALATRLFVVEEDVRELKASITTGFASLNAKFDERSKIQWPALSLFLAFCIAIGTLAYWPIRERQGTLEFVVARDAQLRREEDRRLWDALMVIKVDQARNEGMLWPKSK